MIMTRGKILPLLLATLVSVPALSATPVYLGLRAGTDLDNRFDDLGGNINTDTPYGGYVGWRINDLFAVEFAASDLGQSKRSNIADGGLDVDGALYQLGLVASLPVSEQFEVLGGVGGFRLNEDGKSSTIAGSTNVDLGDSGVYLEVGARYRFNPQWSVRTSYAWYDFESGSDGNFWGGVQLDF
jgi:OmpA-OmpF porin, OOP family